MAQWYGVWNSQLPVAALTANATGTQASALTGANSQIPANVLACTVASASSGYSVVLPPSAPGSQVDVQLTTGGNTALVFPYPGDAINALGVNNSITMSALTSTTFTCVVQGQWWTNPRVPS